MDFWQNAERQWRRNKARHLQDLALDPALGRQIQQQLATLFELGDYETRPRDSWSVLEDPYWFDCHMVAVWDRWEDKDHASIILDRKAGEPVMRLVGQCSWCDRRVVLDMEVTDHGDLWGARQYGVPYQHRCPKQMPTSARSEPAPAEEA